MPKKRTPGRSEMVPLDHLVPDERNANARESISDIVESIRAFGQDQDIVAQASTGKIIKGNHRYLAMRELGFAECRVFWVDDDQQKAAARALADNRTHDLRHWDWQVLQETLAALDGSPPGFDEDFLALVQAECDMLVKGIDGDAFANQEGEDDEAFWPVVRVKVPPEVYAKWQGRIREHGGELPAFEAIVK